VDSKCASQMTERKHQLKEWKDAGNGSAYLKCWCGATATTRRESIHTANESHRKTLAVLAALTEED
jgi:hypothetical protein